MKLLTAAQTRAADAATIEEEGIGSDVLMERAATAFTNWLTPRLTPADAGNVLVLCGPGNNGGDGLAVARLLHQRSYHAQVWLLPAERHSADWEINRQRLPAKVEVLELNPAHLPAIAPGTVVVDALFGTGLNRPLDGPAADVVRHLNAAQARVVSIDVPSGLLSDAPQPPDSAVVQARHTVAFELPKLAFLLPQNAPYVGQWHTVPIGLSADFLAQVAANMTVVDAAELAGRLPRRGTFSHKGTYGHALLLAGSKGKIGAAVLAARASLHGGAGLLTLAVPAVGYAVAQTAVPEAMCLPDDAKNHLTTLPDLQPYAAVGMGPGIGQHDDTRAVLEELLCTAPAHKVPLVLDADALNLLGANRPLLDLLPPDTVLTPHPKEFERLTQPARNDYHRLELLRDFASRYRCYVVLKGAYSCTATPEGHLYFNTTGNPGLATGGTGDVLTGLLTALRADQRLSPLDATLLAVYAHGRAADLAVVHTGQAGLTAGALPHYIGVALQELTTPDETL
ncbi:NAD(P)H-hydrate dehydratase [Hymenobacter busanensis]|uniref:Bifunctional NAD(P)H-hydrate repair enzyme n=1 Tax=Hymenobacter busanensis TaxID=2607656 RepID=A0A7L5A0M5_9BACT|nr:NAD(P)H-hydrate dehydratase [Hymenobacter busanensis]KAA9331481.1 NAD(P)H-hydrate dehydratase [Hymenobacter busanensis]QHJ08636.1 NAD(P)H-hydrate dehydratase [Hymenobacter busanensis]